MYVYAVCCANPHEDDKAFFMFIASERFLPEDEVRAKAIDVVREDALGHEWVEALADSHVGGPLELEGGLKQPTIAVKIA